MNVDLSNSEQLTGVRAKGSRSKGAWCATAFALLAVFGCTTVSLRAQTISTLHSFDGADGAQPIAALAQGTDGNLYGVTNGGGASGDGTVFRITPGGTLTPLHSFDSTDGADPWPLVQGRDGNFYGTTYTGGANSTCYAGGCGTVFKMNSTGTVTTLHSFCSEPGCADGNEPYAGLTLGSDGNLYGTTSYGGSNYACSSYGCGTVFKITPGGTLTTLYSFCSQSGCTDGFEPQARLVLGTDGNFYGTTVYGGSNPGNPGTVFKITAAGVLTTLYSFCSQADCTDGFQPLEALVQGTDGSFYGVTDYGGSSNPCFIQYGCGTAFRITPKGALTTLHAFCALGGSCLDGAGPTGLFQATDGNLYGTTYYGGSDYSDCADGCGTIFEIAPTGGTLNTLVSFDSVDGANPYHGGLVQDTNGKFYGTTWAGGVDGDGTVFSLATGLGPFVKTEPTSGKVGATVKILGTNLVGATSVTFNGTSASFTVNKSGSLITTTVPSGATTGYVQVTTPHGTLTSNVVFRVKP